MFHHRNRAAAVLSATVVALVLSGPGAAVAAKKPKPPPSGNPTTDLTTTAVAIPGGWTAAETIPAGTPLHTVRLDTSDPYDVVNDGGVIGTSEYVGFSINGSTVATAVKAVEYLPLQTNLGQLFGPSFVLGGTTYLLVEAGTDLTGLNATTADSVVRNNGVTAFETYRYGLLPAGAAQRHGPVHLEVFYGPDFRASETQDASLYDADDVPGSSDSPGEEVLNGRAFDGYTSVLANARLADGATVQVPALRRFAASIYGQSYAYYYFDQAALATAGATTADVQQVVSFTPAAHSFTWTGLGFAPATS